MYDQNFRGEGVLDGEGEGVAVEDPWKGIFPKNIIKQRLGKGKSCS